MDDNSDHSHFFRRAPGSYRGENDHLHVAKGAFERFSNVWEFDDFWTRGNTFDAYLRFVDAAELKWPNDPVVQQMSALREKIIRTNHEYFLSKYNSNVWWTDDYGWWAMACLTARLGE